MLIVDPAIHPYFIKTEKSSYNVCQYHKPKSGKDYEKFVSSHPDIEAALKKVVELKIESKGGAQSLIEYLKEIRSLKLEIRRITHDDLDARLAFFTKEIKRLDDRIESKTKNSIIDFID